MGLISQSDIPCIEDKNLLVQLVFTCKASYEAKQHLIREVHSCDNYAHYQRLTNYLESIQPSIDEIPNPSERDILKHFNRFIHF